MANKAFRHALTTGVVLASACAVALTPVTATPEVHVAFDTPRVVSTSTMPAGLIQDLQVIGSGARSAVEQSVNALTHKIPDLWWTVHEQWPDADLLHWNYALVSDIFLAPITPLLIGPFNDAVADAVARHLPVLGDEIRRIPDFVEYAFVRLIGPVLSAIGGAGVAHSEIFYSMTTLRIEPFIEAIVRAPFHVIDGLLFGGYGDLGPILPGREGQYLPAPGLLTPWGQPPRDRDIKTPDDIVTVPAPNADADADADADAVSLSSGRDDAATAADTPVTAPVPERVIETPQSAETAAPVADDAKVTVAESVTDETETETGTPAKRAKVDPVAGIRQGIKNFRAGVHNTVKKLTGRGVSSRADSQSGGDTSESTTSEPTGAKDTE